MKKPKIVRTKDGLFLSLTLKQGTEMVTYTETVKPGPIEAAARLAAEAKIWQRVAEDRHDMAKEQARSTWPTVGQYFKHWFHYRYERGLWGKGLSQKGREQEVMVLWRAVPEHYRAMPMDLFMIGHANAIVTHFGKAHSSSYTFEFYTMLRSMFADACRYGWESGTGKVPWRARGNPFDLVRAPRVQTKVKRTLDADELHRIIVASEQLHGEIVWQTSVIAIQAILGLRLSDAALLTWERLHLRPFGEFIGYFEWAPGESKGTQGLRLPIPRALERYLPLDTPAHERVGKIFPSPGDKGDRCNAINDELRAAAAAAGIERPEELTSHCIRHSFAQAIYARAGAVTADVSRALGHTSERITQDYLRGVNDTKRIGLVVGAHAEDVFDGVPAGEAIH